MSQASGVHFFLVPFPPAGRKFFSSAAAAGFGHKVCSVLGAQWGDEGKGKLVDVLAQRYDVIGRFNGGSNAGHTLVVNGKKYAMHLIPCGILIPGKVNVIGNGVVLHVPTMFKELANLEKGGIDWKNRLLVSDRAHLLFDFHQTIDGLQETSLGRGSIGTTKKGIGPCYSSKTTRNGVRVGELIHNWDNFAAKYTKLVTTLQKQYGFEYNAAEELERFKGYRELLRPMVTDTAFMVNHAIASGKSVLAEGANAALLDVDHGTYPFVTSSSTAAGGISTGLGIAPNKVACSIGVVKAYTTRVGSGPFPTELECAVGQKMRDVGHEYGTTTGAEC